MRSVRGNRHLFSMSAAMALVVVAGVACGGNEASSRPELPGGPQPVATIVGDGASGLVPGEQRAPGSPAVTTTTPTRPIGRPLNPVPVNRTLVTRAPVPLTEVVTTTSAPATKGTS